MTKRLRYLGVKDGLPKFEEIEVEEIVIQQQYNYDQLVIEYIREKYSIDDEFSLNSKSMQIFINSCTEDQKVKWMQEITEFSIYREECKKKAREICVIE